MFLICDTIKKENLKKMPQIFLTFINSFLFGRIMTKTMNKKIKIVDTNKAIRKKKETEKLIFR